MKTTWGVIAAAVGTFSACAALGGGRALSGGPELPEASGTVTFHRLGPHCTGIDLQVKHLSEPEKLLPPGYTYVAWVQKSPEDRPRNVGALNVGADLNGELRTMTPLRRFDLFVTDEATSDAAAPAGPRLLWASR
jgi:hypothetical protein